MPAHSLLPLLASAALIAPYALADGAAPAAPEPIRTLLITGHNNHNWQYTSRAHKDTLEATGRFQVDITDDPAATLADAPGLAKYRLFVLDYNDYEQPKRWGSPSGAPETNFTDAVRSGTGLVAIHSADNAFRGWKEYEQMLGLMWERNVSGHGPFHEFAVQIIDKDHPITRGLSPFAHHPDELYHGLINAQNTSPHILMQATDDKEAGGAGGIEPMALTSEFGKGRIFATTLGHVWNNEPKTKYSITDPQFRTLLARGAEWAATGTVALPITWSDVRPHNTLTPAETADGWRLLFDGTPASAHVSLREYKREVFPEKGWAIRDGAIVHAAGPDGGDLITNAEFGDFEFACQWKITKGGNSGIMYHVTEDHSQPYETGPEMQILDDEVHADKAKDRTRAGALYDLFGCAADVVNPAGEWNSARIRIKGTHAQFWLNGFKVINADSTSEAYKKALAESKWAKVPDFNTRTRGRIDLQNHGDEVWFRDLKVRDLHD